MLNRLREGLVKCLPESYQEKMKTKNDEAIICIGKSRPRGVASLPVVITFTVLLVAVGAVVASISLTDSLLSANLSDSSLAAYYARAGVRDALERVVRNKDYSGTYSIDMVTNGCTSPFAGCATVSVDTGSNPKIASSTGRVGNVYRRLRANVTLDANGLITNHTWQEE